MFLCAGIILHKIWSNYFMKRSSLYDTDRDWLEDDYVSKLKAQKDITLAMVEEISDAVAACINHAADQWEGILQL